jgi:DivIVA domain-containing protein
VVTALIYLLVAAVVGGVFFLLASVVFGRGEELAPLEPRTTLTTLPAAGVTGDDVRGLRFVQAVRGSRVSEVDWALERLAGEVDALRAELAGRTVGAVPGDGPEPEPEHPTGAGPRHAEPEPPRTTPTSPAPAQEDHP